jgi:hypothetical protein
MINDDHTAACGVRKESCASNLCIDHLRPDQLRRRAADARADALALAGRLSAASVAMLLNDAAQCELRASLLDMEGTQSAFQKVGDAPHHAA